MPFKISEFQGEINRKGVSRTDHFEIIFTPPNSPVTRGIDAFLNGSNVFNAIKRSLEGQGALSTFDNITGFASNLDIARSIMLRARSVNLPGRSIATTEYFEHGSEYKLATASNYQNVTINVLCSENLAERDFFLEWQDLAVGNHRTNIKGSRNGFFGRYYRDYVSTAIIKVYNEAGKNRRNVLLQEIYPVSILDIQYDWGTSEHAILPVDLAFRYFYDDRITNSILDVLDKDIPSRFKVGDVRNLIDFFAKDEKNNPNVYALPESGPITRTPIDDITGLGTRNFNT